MIAMECYKGHLSTKIQPYSANYIDINSVTNKPPFEGPFSVNLALPHKHLNDVDTEPQKKYGNL